MTNSQSKRILGECHTEDFVGRDAELNRLMQHAKSGDETVPLTVVGAPGVGVSELLKQTYDRLFSEQTSIIPFYFAIGVTDETAWQTAHRFLHQFLLQTVAFRRSDPSILSWYPDIGELSELAVPTDGHWIDRLVEASSRDYSLADEQTILQTCLAAPSRATANGAPVFVIIDNCHAAAGSDDAEKILNFIKSVYHGSGIPYVLAGRRRFPFNQPAAARLSIEKLPLADICMVIEKTAQRRSVKINDETRDLIAHQFSENLNFIQYIFQSATERNCDLDSFLNVQSVRVHEVFGGRIRRHYDAVLHGIARSDEIEKGILSLMDVSLTMGKSRLSVESWQKRLSVGEVVFAKILGQLNINELIQLAENRIEMMSCSDVLTDYISARFRLEVIGENRAALFSESLAAQLKRAPLIMSRFYRCNASIGLRKLLSSFSLQQVPNALLDYGVYVDRYKGTAPDEILINLDSDSSTVDLPLIVNTSNAADLYQPIGELMTRERSAVAIGFQQGKYSDDDEIAWIAAEIDSKLEVSKDLAEFWCDRLEMVALMCGFANYQVWIVAPEGFSPEAVDVLRQRNAFGSSRVQAKLLKQFLDSEFNGAARPVIDEYEMIMPMDGESELIAARTLEEIAKRHNFGPKAINQIKTALLEASINASEHSLSPDRRIHQKFSVENDRIVITISNRGLRLTDRGITQPEPESARRGWGLKLIAKLMDEVKIQQTDDGTSISMTKYLPKEVLV